MKLSKAVEIRAVCLPEEPKKYKPHFDKFNTTNSKKNKVTSNSSINHRKGRKIEYGETRSNNTNGKSSHNNNLQYLKAQIKKISEKYISTRKPSKSDNYSYQIKSPTKCIATGWGRFKTQGPITSTLLQATVPLHDNSLCQAKYGDSVPIRTGHLCAGRLDGTTGTCVVSN